MLLKDPARIEGLLCCYFIALLCHTLIEREIRHAMAQHQVDQPALYHEQRPCQAPTAARVLEQFTGTSRHHLTRDGHPVQVFEPELTPLQRQTLDLLGVPRGRGRARDVLAPRDLAQTGQVPVAEPTRQALHPSLAVRDLGPREFKNVAQPIGVYALEFEGEASVGALPIDPVCQMAVEPNRAATARIVNGRAYHFCSRECATAFDADPSRYIQR